VKEAADSRLGCPWICGQWLHAHAKPLRTLTDAAIHELTELHLPGSLPERQLAVQHELSRLDAELGWLDEVRAALSGLDGPDDVGEIALAGQERLTGLTLQSLRT
jgi:hypothetical protein